MERREGRRMGRWDEQNIVRRSSLLPTHLNIRGATLISTTLRPLVPTT